MSLGGRRHCFIAPAGRHGAVCSHLNLPDPDTSTSQFASHLDRFEEAAPKRRLNGFLQGLTVNAVETPPGGVLKRSRNTPRLTDYDHKDVGQ